MKELRALAAIVCGAVGGAVAWVVGELIVHGVCGIPVLHFLWCTIGPGPGGSIAGPKLDFFDVLAFPLFVAIGISAFWKVWVRGGGWFED